MEAIKQTNKVQKATAASHSTGKSAMSGSFAPERASAVPSYIQTKLSVNKPGDKYEREADSVADKVMRMSSDEPKQSSFSGEKSQGIQRQSQGGNLTVNNPNVAIKAFSPTMITRKFNQGYGEEKNIQRKENKPNLELKNQENSQLLETELKGTKGSGQPLSPQTNAFMSKAMGTDFSQVRIHTDAKAVAMNKAVHAHAFTHGKDIYFNTGKYDPESASGKHLLAHELTHVVQQGGGTSKIQKHDESNKIQRKKRSISADTAFQSVLTKVKQTAQKAKKHEPTSKKVKAAQMAAKPPKNEKASKAKDTKVAEMAQQEPKAFNEAKFKEALKSKIAALQLNSLKEADEFKKNNGAEAIKGDMASQVSSEKTSAVGDIDKKTKEEPNAGKETGKEVGSEPTAENTIAAPAISGQQAAPKPVDGEDISLQKESQSLDAQMSEAKVTETQLSKSNEPKFNNALANKKTAQEDALKRPQEFRKDEKGIISQAQMIASGTSKNHLGAMVGNRKKQTGNVLSKQQLAKIKDEQDRAKIAADIELKFTTTKTDVESILSNLDKDVNSIFDSGIANATQLFQNYVDAKMDAYKDDRYDGITGAAQWLIDKFKGLPDEVNRFYKEGKDLYTSKMDEVINRVAKLVAKQLNEAKNRINAGKKEIKVYVASLPKNLQKIGADAAKDIQSKFSELESSVDSKQSELVDSLAAKYKAGMDNIDTKISEMKEANKGLISKAIGAIKDVIDTIIAFKNMLLDVLARAAAAIQLIIDDPIGFLGNLVAGVKLGIQNFVGNILTHLKAGLMGWLFGTLASAGIDVPKSFDFKGILTLILQVLGLTYANIRSRAVNIVGEKVVSGLEKAAEIFIIIKNEGIGGLWRFIKEKVEDLKETVISSIKEFVVTKIITAGVTWLISMLNPASAFVKACKMIYDVIMFFVNRGKQIMALVNAVIDSVTAIAKGNISVAANFVENALAKAIPVAIGFLASLLGLDGISEKIKAIIQKIQAPINKAIDWVINKAVSLVKGVAGLFSGGKDKRIEEKSEHSPEKQAKIDAGLITMHQEQSKYLKDGKITKEDAQKVANTVKGQHSVFSSFTVEDAGKKIDFFYTASPKKKAGEIEEVDGDTLPLTINQKVKHRLTENGNFSYGVVAKIGKCNEEPFKQFGGEGWCVIVSWTKGAKKGVKQTMRANEIKNEGAVGYRLDDGSSDHNLFSPKELKGKGTSNLTYKTLGDTSFDVEFGENQLVKSIKGTKLKLKKQIKLEGRGITQRPEGYKENENLNASHLIADEFLGSGYKESANLVITSAHFNQIIMRGVENKIKEFIIVNKAMTFSLEVSVTWGELLNEKVFEAIMARLPQADREEVKSEIKSFIERVNPTFKRVMDAAYIAEVDDIINTKLNTGPDAWLGKK